jgi:hypothetical protein
MDRIPVDCPGMNKVHGPGIRLPTPICWVGLNCGVVLGV